MAGEYIEFNNNSQPAINDTNLNRLQQLIKQDIQGAVSGDTLPVGAIMLFGSDTIPDNWLLCDGQAVSRTTYQELFNTIGTTYGTGDGFTTFNLPNLKGKVPVGKDTSDTDFDTLGETRGEKTHTLTVNEMPNHSHNVDSNNFGASSTVRVASGDYANVGNPVGEINIGNIGGGQPHNNLQPYIVQNYIIKAAQSSGVVATVVDNLTSTSATNALSANQGRILNDRFNYSTTEKVVGTWIDGKPLYRKVVNLGALPDNNTKSIAHSIQNLKRVVKLEGFAGSSVNKGGITLPHATNAPVALYVDDTNVSVKTSNNASAYTEAYAFVYYTKTTD